MIYKYYHLYWVLSFSFGIVVYRKYIFSDKFSVDINILFILLFSFLIISILSFFIIRKFVAGNCVFLKTILVLSILIFFFTGFARYGLHTHAADKNIFNLIFETVESRNSKYSDIQDVPTIAVTGTRGLSLSVEGRVACYPEFYRGNLYFLFEAENIILSGAGSFQKEQIMAGDLISVRVKTRSSQLLKRDEVIRFDGCIKKNENSLFLVTEEARIEKINPISFKDRIFFVRGKFYSCLSNIFSKSLSSSFAGLCKAAILGDTGSLSKNIKQNFIKSGVYHLLAISGMHVSFFVFIISLVLNFITGILARNYKKSIFIRVVFFVSITIFLFFYNFLIGNRASILRSTFMSGLVIMANSVKREHDRKNILSQVFIFTLLLNPEMFTDAGFWLSFTAVGAIIYTNNIYHKLFEIFYCRYKKIKFCISNLNELKIRKNFFIETIITTFSVNIFIFPIIAFLFKEFSLLSFFTNVLVIPLFYVLLLLLIIFSITGLFWPPISVLLMKTVNAPIYLILKITGIWKVLDFGIIQFKNFNMTAVAVYYFILLTFLFLLSRFVFSRKHIGV